MGGGVGKAISGLVKSAAYKYPGDEHHVICLEKPVKSYFVDIATKAGCKFVYAPSQEEFEKLVSEADIVQLEFWNHPSLIKYLCVAHTFNARLLVWCHISGLHFPVIPSRLIEASQSFLLTSPCSYESPEIVSLPAKTKSKLDVISSGGVDDLPFPDQRIPKRTLECGYMGTLNFSKLHPEFVAYAATVANPEFHVSMHGDDVNRDRLKAQCAEISRQGLLRFYGYASDVPAVLSQLGVFAYILNPFHYGTAENSLIEAMAMGVVPIVLNNPCETAIVKNGSTGTVIHSKAGFAVAVESLHQSPETMRCMADAAIEDVRTRFTFSRASDLFHEKYEGLMSRSKEELGFIDIFGRSPVEAMSMFYRDASILTNKSSFELSDPLSRHSLSERTKGSVWHFLEYFHEDADLKRIAHHISALIKMESVPTH